MKKQKKLYQLVTFPNIFVKEKALEHLNDAKPLGFVTILNQVNPDMSICFAFGMAYTGNLTSYEEVLDECSVVPKISVNSLDKFRQAVE